MRRPLFIVTGPTASGKSSVITELAKEYPIEVFNADSRQLYEDMPIGTAQPNLEKQDVARYHLVHCISPNQTYSAGSFIRYFKNKIEHVYRKKHIPFIVGGTYFYIEALLHGLMKEPFISDGLKEEVNSFDSEKLIRELKIYDPRSLELIHANNLQRLKRALVVSIASEFPFSSFRKEGGVIDEYEICAWTIHVPRDELYHNINLRTKKMLKMGWIQEATSLLKKGYDESCPGLRSLGYPEIISLLKVKNFIIDNISQEEFDSLVNIISQKTRNFAKRQLTWLNNQTILKKLDRYDTKNTIAGCINSLVGRI